MEKLKILMVSAAFYPYVGGAERQAQKLAAELKKKSIEISVVTGRWNKCLRKMEEIAGIRVYRNLATLGCAGKEKLNTGLGIFYTDAANRKPNLKKIKIFLGKISYRLSIYIYQVSLFFFLLKHKNSYDIIHVHQVLYPAFVSVLAAKLLKKSVIAKVGNSGFNSDINQIKKFPEGKLQLRYILNNINKIVCTTTIMKEEFLNEGLCSDKITLIHNGVTTEDFSRTYRTCNNLVFVGRFIKNKNIITLVHAFSRIIAEINGDAKLLLIGDGPEKESIIKLISELGLGKIITLTGMVKNTEKYLKESDIFILPSLVEGLSNSLIEALSFKMPSIVSGIAGNIEVAGSKGQNYNIGKGSFIIAECGLLYSPEDIDGLVNSYKYLFQNEKVRQSIGENAFARIKSDFDIKAIAEKYIKLYEEVFI
jgi:glycosyltransferase involved in cell wall biosynthesis